MKTRIFHVAFASAVFIAAVLLYGHTVNFNFTWDDPMLLGAAMPPATASDAASAFTKPIDRLYRPVRTLVYMFENHEFKFVPAGYHAVNVLLYALACVAFYAMAAMLLPTAPSAAAAAAVLFLAHPAHAEVAASIGNGCADSLCAIFSFALIACAAPGRRTASGNAACALLFIFALFSKESAIVLPCALFALALSREMSRNNEKLRGALSKSIRYVIPYLIISVVYIALRSIVVRGISQSSTMHGGAFAGNILTSLSVVPDYAAMLLAPVKQCGIYDVPAVALLAVKPALGTALLLAASACALLFIRRSAAVSFSIFFMLVTWLPSSGIIPLGSIKASRFIFLPSAGACLLAGILIYAMISRVTARQRIIQISVAIASISIGIFYAAYARGATESWRDSKTLWSESVQCAPHSPVAWNNLGKIYSQEGRTNDALSAFNKAVEINPSFPQPYDNLAAVYGSTGRYTEAIGALLRSKSVTPANPDTDCKLWFCYRKLGMQKEADIWRAACMKATGKGDSNAHGAN